MPKTPKGNQYIVTLTDYFSKWAEAAALPDKTAHGVARFIYTVMCIMGCPETLITNQGREFVNELSAALYKITRTEHRITSAYHPQFNQTLSMSLAKITDETHDDWDIKLDTVLMGYRASRQASTKFSPYFMLFQKEMRLPIHNEVCSESHNEEAPDRSPDENIIERLLTACEYAFKKAEDNILAAQNKQKETYDRKHQPDVLAVGTRVLLENTLQKQHKGGKLEPLWLGPYTISKDLGKGLYELTNEAGKVLKKKANIGQTQGVPGAATQGKTKDDSSPPDTKDSSPTVHDPPVVDVDHTKDPPVIDVDHTKSPPAKKPCHLYHRKQSAEKRGVTSVWIKDLDLRTTDKDVILAKAGMLCDKHMYAATQADAHAVSTLRRMPLHTPCPADVLPISHKYS